MPVLCLLVLLSCPCAVLAQAEDCAKLAPAERASCENAKKYGLSLNAARLYEFLAEREFAAAFCGHPLDMAEKRHTQSIVSSDPKGLELFQAHGKMLRERCIYDPDGYCQSMGFGRR